MQVGHFGYAGQTGGVPNGHYVGTVKLFNQDKGWGMLSCEQTHQLYGKDVFFMKSAVPGGVIAQGECVRFSVRMESKGPVATDVHPVAYGGGQPHYSAPYPGMGYGFIGGGPGAAGYGGLNMSHFVPSGMMGAAYGGRVAASGHTFYGKVINFNEEKGWGFINCEATKKMYNKDVFVMKSALKGATLKPGDMVSFRVEVGMKGPQALDIAVLPPDCIGSDGKPGKSYAGTIKKFDAEKGWGFIEGAEVREVFGKDIFVHKRDCSDGQTPPKAGQQVSFIVEMDNNGQPQAKNVAVAGKYTEQATDASAAFVATPAAGEATQALAQAQGVVVAEKAEEKTADAAAAPI